MAGARHGEELAGQAGAGAVGEALGESLPCLPLRRVSQAHTLLPGVHCYALDEGH